MTKNIKILIAEPDNFSNKALEFLKDKYIVDLKKVNENDLTLLLQEYDVIWFRLAFKITESILKIPNLRCKIIATAVTGIDHIDEIACEKRGIKIVCLRGESEFLKKVRATAELTIGLMLALNRHLVHAANDVLTGKWNRDDFKGFELFNKTIGIVGMGRLGSIVASYCKSFEMKVLGFDNRPDFPHHLASKVENLHELISQSDIVSIHLAYNESTKLMLKRTHFDFFKKDAILINTSRGGIIDELALIDALTNKKLRGAALDVIQNELDLTSTNPLIAYASCNSNLLIVPHIGGNTYESFDKTEYFIAEKLVQILSKL